MQHFFIILLVLVFNSNLVRSSVQKDIDSLEDTSVVTRKFSRAGLVHLFRIMEIDVPDDCNLETLNRIAQKEFLRQGGERWEAQKEHQEKFAKKSLALIPALRELGFYTEIRPTRQHYDIVVVFGALHSRMVTRTLYLQQLWHDGIRANKIIYLTGSRELLAGEKEELSSYTDSTHAALERDLPVLIWQKYITEESLRTHEFENIYAEDILVPGTHTKRRANTADTVARMIAILALNKKDRNPVKILAISNNPYIAYQGVTLENVMRKAQVLIPGDSIETVGERANEDTPLFLMMDSLARIIYTITRK